MQEPPMNRRKGELAHTYQRMVACGRTTRGQIKSSSFGHRSLTPPPPANCERAVSNMPGTRFAPNFCSGPDTKSQSARDAPSERAVWRVPDP